MALGKAERPHPADHEATDEVLHLLDDLVRLIDGATAAADTPQRGHAMTVAGKIRGLRQRLDPAQQVSPSRYAGPWYDDLASALADLRGVAWEALRPPARSLRKRTWPDSCARTTLKFVACQSM